MCKFCLENRNNFKIAWKIEIFRKFPRKNQNFVKLLEKSKFLENLPGNIKMFLTQIHDPPDFKPD